MTESLKGPFRQRDDQGRHIVRVTFPGSYKTYAFALSQGLTAAVGDLLWAPANEYSPEGAQVRVKGLGSEYAGELAEITARVTPDHGPAVQVRRDVPTIDDVMNYPGRSRYEYDDNIYYSGPGDMAADHDH
jgi:hypothetical protein